MAEHVFQNLEGMLPELEDLERNGIFSRNELRSVWMINFSSVGGLKNNEKGFEA